MHGKEKLFSAVKAILLGMLCVFVYTISQKQDISINSPFMPHILNGKLICESASLTLPMYFIDKKLPGSFISHSATTDIIYYFVNKLLSLGAIPDFYAQLKTLGFLLFFVLAQRYGGFYAAFFTSAISLPLITTQVTGVGDALPAIFAAIFLIAYTKQIKNKFFLYLLPITQLLWNFTDTSFFLGPIFYATFATFWRNDNSVTKNEHQKLRLIGVAVLITAIVNPLTLEYIFNLQTQAQLPTIFDMPFLSSLLMPKTFFLFSNIFFIVPTFVIGSSLAILFWKKELQLIAIISAIFALILPLYETRYLPHFALIFIPAGAMLIKLFAAKAKESLPRTLFIVLASFSIFVFLLFALKSPFQAFTPHKRKLPSKEVVAFLKSNELKLPVINNAECGSFLSLALLPNANASADLRRGAYNKLLLQANMAAIINEAFWQKNPYKSIFISKGVDYYLNEFIDRRKNDVLWEVVFEDESAIAFNRKENSN